MGQTYAELIGDPVAHSRSPAIHNFWLKKLGIDAEYWVSRVRIEELADYLKSRRSDGQWRGCNVTMPLKERVVPLLDRLDEPATKINAVNCIVNHGGALAGTNTDVGGLSTSLGRFDPGDSVILIGTGGAARAALYNFKTMNAASVHVIGRTREKAKRLLDEFDQRGEGWTFTDRPSFDSAVRLINATPLGMSGHDPMPEEGLRLADEVALRGQVLDMIYHPPETDLLKRARERGLEAVNGLGMLIEQARQAFELFFQVLPGRELDEELYEMLTS